MFSPEVFLSVIAVSFGSGFSFSSYDHYKTISGIYAQTKENSWWNASAGGCEEFDGQLYIPTSNVIPPSVADILNPGESYWIGAMEYSNWKWTYDNTSLYEYMGYTDATYIAPRIVHIEGNTVFQCHLQCGKQYTYFGLQGSKCYCLQGYYFHYLPFHNLEMRCPGNYEERCGNVSGTSVYRIADINMSLAADGKCVYAAKEKRYNYGYYTAFYQDEHCYTTRSMAYTKTYSEGSSFRCRGNTCVNHGYRSWYQSEEKHKLLKVTVYNKDDLTDAMTPATHRHDNYYTYWVGLRRLYRRVWMNGSNVNDVVNGVLSGRSCLSLYKFSGLILFHWKQCSLKLKALCQTVIPTTSTSMSTLENTSTLPVRTTASSSAADNHTVVMVPAANTQYNAGITIGVILFFIILLALGLIALFMLKRRRLLCFSDKQPQVKSGAVRELPATENMTYSTLEPDDNIYSIPDEFTGQSEYQPSVPVRLPYGNNNPYMNGPFHGNIEGYNVLSHGQALALPTSIHPYDHVCGGIKSMDSKGSNMTDKLKPSDPETVKMMTDNYDHCQRNAHQGTLPGDNKYLSLDGVTMAKDGQPVQSDSSGYLHLARGVPDYVNTCRKGGDQYGKVGRAAQRDSCNSQNNIYEEPVISSAVCDGDTEQPIYKVPRSDNVEEHCYYNTVCMSGSLDNGDYSYPRTNTSNEKATSDA